MPAVDIVCWANSRKRGGRCVAGLRTDGGGWIRPVTPRSHPRIGDGALLPAHYSFADGTPARVLDVVRIDVAAPHPEPHQPENWLVGDRQWRLIRRPAPPAMIARMLRSHLGRGPALLGDTSDRIPVAALSERRDAASLGLIVPTDVRWQIRYSRSGRPQTRAIFRLGNAEYNLPITSQDFEDIFIHCAPGEYPVEAAGLGPDERLLFTISLGEPFEYDDCCYKLIAAVVALEAELLKDLD